ncbi:MAG: recombinase family protein, partial [Planctomycetes bacterium]|nr:recombinase family protein [Planctomycetota bacterium]
ENQRQLLRRYVSEQGWNLVDEYLDDGWSGANFDRPGVRRLIEDAKNNGSSSVCFIVGSSHGLKSPVADTLPLLVVRFGFQACPLAAPAGGFFVAACAPRRCRAPAGARPRPSPFRRPNRLQPQMTTL